MPYSDEENEDQMMKIRKKMIPITKLKMLKPRKESENEEVNDDNNDDEDDVVSTASNDEDDDESELA